MHSNCALSTYRRILWHSPLSTTFPLFSGARCFNQRCMSSRPLTAPGSRCRSAASSWQPLLLLLQQQQQPLRQPLLAQNLIQRPLPEATVAAGRLLLCQAAAAGLLLHPGGLCCSCGSSSSLQCVQGCPHGMPVEAAPGRVPRCISNGPVRSHTQCCTHVSRMP
jgi:hypothetical protein